MTDEMHDGLAGQDVITCPRCGFEQPRAAECCRCGVLFAKIRRDPPVPSPRPDVPPAAPPAAVPADSGRSPYGWLALVCLGALVALFFSIRSEPDRPLPIRPTSIPQVSRPETVRYEPPVRMPHTWYEGASGYASAMEEARQDNRVVAVYFYTDWCPYCRELESQLLHTREVEEHFTTVVKVKINPESGLEEEEIARRYGIRGYPSFFIESPKLGRRQRINRSIDDRLKTPEEFVATCRAAAAG